MNMKIAVLGSGGGGTAVAFDWAEAGHEVFLFDFEDFPANLAAIARAGGIRSDGQLEGFAPIAYAGHDIETVLAGAEIVFVVGPAYSTRPFGEKCRPFFQKEQVAVVCPGSCGGAVVFKQALGYGLEQGDIITAETHTLPYAVRLAEPGRINVFLKLEAGIYVAALPRRNTMRVRAMLQSVYPALVPADNILQTSLQNANPVIHPAVTLLNTGLIERTGGGFNFYEEGVTPAVGRLIRAVDEERIAIGRKLGLDIIKDPELGTIQGYMQEPSYDRGYIQARGFKGIKAQDRLKHRYFDEDVAYGLVFWSELGHYVGVPTPTIDAIVRIVSVLLDEHYLSHQARSLESLGFLKYGVEELQEIL